ncbi:hypothetical protein [Streptosporangium roseum]|uniref:hypothetical protein n=1 Tax=Streptosporangium roseum TaxID=2001 RepID=UPI0031EBF9B5
MRWVVSGLNLGQVLEHIVRQLRATTREPAVLRVELQQDREADSCGVTLSGDEVALPVEDRPVLDQLVDVYRGGVS